MAKTLYLKYPSAEPSNLQAFNSLSIQYIIERCIYFNTDWKNTMFLATSIYVKKVKNMWGDQKLEVWNIIDFSHHQGCKDKGIRKLNFLGVIADPL